MIADSAIIIPVKPGHVEQRPDQRLGQ